MGAEHARDAGREAVLQDVAIQRDEDVLIELVCVVARKASPPQVVPDVLVVRGADDGEHLAQEGSFLGGELGASPGELGELLFELGLGCSGPLIGVSGFLSVVSVHGGLAR